MVYAGNDDHGYEVYPTGTVNCNGRDGCVDCVILTVVYDDIELWCQ